MQLAGVFDLHSVSPRALSREFAILISREVKNFLFSFFIFSIKHIKQ